MSTGSLTAIGIPHTKNIWAKLALLVLSMVAGWWALSSFDYERYFSPATLAQWLNDAGPWAPLLLIGSMVCAVIIPSIPSLPLDLASGAAVGRSKTFSKATPMFCALLLALLLIVGIGTGWAADEHAPSHWGYEGEESAAHWGMRSSAYMACEAGSHQSPINISMPRPAQQQEWLVFQYQSGLVRALDNGHTIQVNVPPGNELHLNGRTYYLSQFHFHDPSEHHVDGRTYPMEIHMVHQDRMGHVVVIGLLVETGSPNQSLADIWAMLPMRAGELGGEHPFNPQDLIPPHTHHFSYHGSLTTPPCTEGVHWIILRDPISMSAQQVAQFISIIGRNARPVQPLLGRRVQEE